MKIHLPKSLSIALLTVICCVASTAGAAITSETIGSGEDTDTKYTMGSDSSKHAKEYTDGALTMDGNDTLGIYDASGSLVTADFGKYNYGTHTGNAITNMLVVGSYYVIDYVEDLTMSGNARIALGGQWIGDRKILWNTTKNDIYSGIKAANASISGNAELIAGSAELKSLSVSGTANVTLHGVNSVTEGSGAAEYTGGNNWKDSSPPNSVVSSEYGHKMTIISGALSVADSAQVTIGVDNGQYGTYKTSHYLTCLGGTITQDTSSKEGEALSSLAIKGKTYISGTLNLTQNGGTMEMGLKADSSGSQKALVYLSSEKDNKITQNGAGTLTVGKLVKGLDDAENSQIIISQTGTGILNMDNGIDFTSASDKASSITQSGGGEINLYGDFTSADFTVDQNKGTINLYGAMDLVGKENNIEGTFAVNSGATLAAVSADALLTITGQGTLENSGTVGIATVVDGGALTLNGGTMADVKLINGDIYVNGATTTGALTLTGGTITFDLNPQMATFAARTTTTDTVLTADSLEVENTKIVVNLSEDAFNNLEGSTFKLFNVSEGETDLSQASVEFTDGTQTKTATIENNSDGSFTVKSAQLVVPEPTTATLSLLALAALAARRRRK